MQEQKETLHKVKTRFILGDLGLTSIKAMASFYEVTESEILKVVKEHEEELLSDGVIFKTNTKIQEYLAEGRSYTFILFNKEGNLEIGLDDGRVLRGEDTSTMLFPRRAVLRVGMLLEDSAVAREVREYLFNVERQTTPEQKVGLLEEEQELNLRVGAALMSGDAQAIEQALEEQKTFKEKHRVN